MAADVVERIGEGWEPERVPDGDLLYMRVHRTWIQAGELNTAVFRNHGSGMSVDWEKYSTPRQTQARARTPEDNAVIQFSAGDARKIPGQTVEHTPILENRAHCDVLGRKDQEARVRFGRIFALAPEFTFDF